MKFRSTVLCTTLALLTGAFLLVMTVFSRAQAPTQSRSELEKERAAIQKEIEDVKRSLDETHKNKRETLGQLALLQRRLKLRESAIRNINDQINVIQGDMNESWREILKLRRELDTLRIQYAESIVFAYKNRSNYDFLNFIFSATSFNDAIKRIQYLKSYRAYREERAENIRRTQDLLQSKIDGLKITRHQSAAIHWPSWNTCPAGVCIHELSARIQNADTVVPIATSALATICSQSGTRFMPKSITPRKVASRKKAVSTS